MDISNPPRVVTHLFPEGRLYPGLVEVLHLTRTELHAKVVTAWEAVQQAFVQLPIRGLNEKSNEFYPVLAGTILGAAEFIAISSDDTDNPVGIWILVGETKHAFFPRNAQSLKSDKKGELTFQAWNNAIENLDQLLLALQWATQLVWATSLIEMLLRCQHGTISVLISPQFQVAPDAEEVPYCSSSMLLAWEDGEIAQLLQRAHDASFGSSSCNVTAQQAILTWIQQAVTADLPALELTVDNAITLNKEIFGSRSRLTLKPDISFSNRGPEFQWTIEIEQASTCAKRLLPIPTACAFAIATQYEEMRQAVSRILCRDIMCDAQSLIFKFAYS